MKKRVFHLEGVVLATLLSANISLFSQTVSYTILENDPDSRKVFLELNPFNAQYYGPNTNIGIDAGLLVLIGSRLQAEANFRRAYLDSRYSGEFAPTTGLKKASQFSAGVSLNLISSEKIRDNKVVLSSGRYGRNSVSVSSINVSASSRNIVALRGGLVRFHNNVVIDNDITEPFTENDIQAVNESGQLVYIRDTINYETINYEVNSAGFYAGINIKTIRRVLIDASGYGEKSNHRIDDIYADVLICPLVKYEIKPNMMQEMFSKLDFNNDVNKKKKLGWRVGWNYLSNKTAGFSWRFEGGQQPGRPGNSWFLSMGIGLSIGVKIPALSQIP